jgi:acetyl-CoA C-acetyltransferase
VDYLRVCIVGIGHGKFGNRSDATVQELSFEPYKMAIEDTDNLRREDIDALVVGSVPEYHMQRSLPGVVAEYVGMNPKSVWLTEAACASGSAAIRTAYMSIKSGMHDIVAVIGVQKMRELSTEEILALMGRVGDVQWESIYGTTFPGYYALYANRHMYEFGTTKEQMALVAVKNHYYGSQNPYAFFQKEVGLDRVLNSDDVASPVNVFDCCANADGAACVIMTNEKLGKKFNDTPIWLEGLGSASAQMSLLRRPNLVEIPSAVEAAKQAYSQAKVEPSDIHVADVHDCFTIAEIMAYENLNFCSKGKGGKFIEDKESYIGGKTPVNVDGGLKAKGHPVGATGVSMTTEIVKQLRGEAGKRQVANAEIGLTHNVGGIGQYTFVHILRR